MHSQNWKCCHIKLWIIIKESSIWQAFNIICILFYWGLHTMAIDVVTWKKKKWCIWSLHLRNFLCLPVFALFLQKLCLLSCNSSNFINIYLKFKLGTEKHICLKWVFLPQWTFMSTCRRIDDTVHNGWAWKMPFCICSCRLYIKSEVYWSTMVGPWEATYFICSY